MSIERIVIAMAGLFVIISTTLAYYHHIYWLFLTLFVGVNLFQAAFTGFCPMAIILKKLGKKSGHAFS